MSSKTIVESLGENLRSLRTERGLTQHSLARQCGLSLSFVQLVERGKKWVSPDTISVFARVLKVREARLFFDGSTEPEIDSKQILFILSRALGVSLNQDTIGKLKVRTPLGTYTALYDSMPEDLAHLFSDRCQKPDWNWEKLRRFLA